MITLLLHLDGGDGSTEITDSSRLGHTVTPQGNAKLTTATARFGPTCLNLGGGAEGNALRMHFDGSNGAQTFTDDSPQTHTMLYTGAVALSNIRFKFGTTSALFDGSSTIYIDADPHFLLPSDFSLDFAINFVDNSIDQRFVTCDSAETEGWGVYYEASPSKLIFKISEDTLEYEWSPALDTFYHIAITRYGPYVRMYIQGFEVGELFRATGIIVADSQLRVVDPDVPFPAFASFKVITPDRITAVETVGTFSPGSYIAVAAKQNLPVTSEDADGSVLLKDLSTLVLGLRGLINVGINMASTDGIYLGIDELNFHYTAEESYSGVLNRIQVIKYEGEIDKPVLLQIGSIPNANSDFSNILIRIDNEPVPYCLINYGDSGADVVVQSNRLRDNLTVHVDSGEDVYWSADGLGGNSLDWMTGTGTIFQQGYWRVEDGAWHTDGVGALYAEAEIPFGLRITLKKSGSLTTDEAHLEVTYGTEIKWRVSISEKFSTVNINGVEVEKNYVPWNDNWITLDIRVDEDKIIYSIDNQTVYTEKRSIVLEDPEEARVAVVQTNCGVDVKGIYIGELVRGTALPANRDGLDYKFLSNEKPRADGYALYAGTTNLDSLGILFMVSNGIFLEEDELDIEMPPEELEDGKIFGFLDMKLSKYVLLYSGGLKTYIYQDSWSLLEDSITVIGLYKSEMGEGIIYKGESENSVYVKFFQRDSDLNMYLAEGAELFSALPQDMEYKFEAPLDFRKQRKTIPWVWVREE